MNCTYSGFITMEEFKGIIQSIEEKPTREEIQDMINEADSDGSGNIDFGDFLNIMAKKMKVIKFLN